MCLYSSVFYMCVHCGWWERILTCCLSNNALYLECFTGLHFKYACRFILGRDGWRVGSLSLWWPEMAQQYWVSVISRLLSPPAPFRLPIPPIPPPLFVPSSPLLLPLFPLLLSSLCPLLLTSSPSPLSSPLSPPPLPSSPPLSLSSTSHPTSTHPGAHVLLPHVYWAGKTWKVRVPSTAATAGVSVCSSQQWCQEILSVMWVTYRSLS